MQYGWFCHGWSHTKSKFYSVGFLASTKILISPVHSDQSVQLDSDGFLTEVHNWAKSVVSQFSSDEIPLQKKFRINPVITFSGKLAVLLKMLMFQILEGSFDAGLFSEHLDA